MNNGLDPITTQVIRNALSSISDEMALVIMRLLPSIFTEEPATQWTTRQACAIGRDA